MFENSQDTSGAEPRGAYGDSDQPGLIYLWISRTTELSSHLMYTISSRLGGTIRQQAYYYFKKNLDKYGLTNETDKLVQNCQFTQICGKESGMLLSSALNSHSNLLAWG